MKKLALMLVIAMLFSLASCTPRVGGVVDTREDRETDAVKENETAANGEEGGEDTTAAKEPKPEESTANTQKAEETTKAPETEVPEKTKPSETKPSETKPSGSVAGGGSITVGGSDLPPVSTEAPVKQETPKTGYEAIKCMEAAGTKAVYLAKSEHNEAVSAYIPNDWSLSGNKSEGYTVYRGGAAIGRAVFVSSISHSACEKCEQLSRLGVVLDACVQKNASSYDRRLVFTNKAGDKIAVTVGYQYVSDNTLSKIKNTMRSNLLYSDPKLGSIHVSQSNGQNRILILGNSFVETSRVGDFLGSMISGGNKKYKVDAVSRGYYSVSSYVQDEGVMANIRNGSYGFVFLCGIYGYNDGYDLKYMVEACNASDTVLVVFPAHNESAEFIAEAKKQYYNVHFLDWKSEVDMLIDTGIPWSAFCIDDAHKHSTPLAGYVGAHMIYRSMFGEIPPSVGANVSDCPQSYIDSYLGEYVSIGGVPNFPDSEIYLF